MSGILTPGTHSANRLSKGYAFESYLENIYFNTSQTDFTGAMEKLQYFKKLVGHCGGFPLLFFVIDYSSQQYVVHTGTNNVIPDYHPRDFLDGGLNMLRHVYNKDDFRIYNQEIFSRNCEFLKSVPQHEHDNYIFSYTFRIETSGHLQEHILQKGGYITAVDTGLPLFSYGICMNISSLKKETRMIHTIEKKDAGETGAFQTVSNNYFFPDQEDTLLTNKEKEILRCIAEGLGTKEIAHKMKVADTTIITHRKNMMMKTNTKNSMELVAHCIRKRII